MAYFSVTPPDQPQTTQNLEAMTTGFDKVIVDGAWLGSMKEGSKLLWNLGVMSKDIITAAYPGTVLGVRHLGASPTVTFEAVESTLANIRQFCDFEATVRSDRLSLGRQNRVGSTHTLDAYGEGPGRRTRKLSLYRVTLMVDGDINLFDPEDFCTFRVIAKVLPQMNLSEAEWYGELVDSPPA